LTCGVSPVAEYLRPGDQRVVQRHRLREPGLWMVLPTSLKRAPTIPIDHGVAVAAALDQPLHGEAAVDRSVEGAYERHGRSGQLGPGVKGLQVASGREWVTPDVFTD